MLKILVQYSENPLGNTGLKASTRNSKHTHRGSLDIKISGKDKLAQGQDDDQQLGNFETERLLTAITKIADLLRKCWGVAGAGIIKASLVRTKEGRHKAFNPTVPGKQVYALFGFIAINEWGKLLKALDKDIMGIINDVAHVVHDEVYRWAHGDSGQCNKNLNSAFLMVFRIGLVQDVRERLEKATDVVFNKGMKSASKVRKRKKTNNRRVSRGTSTSVETTSLSSLPGIQAFSDKALLSFLKSFAGIHRSKKIREWQQDFRLGAGVGSFTVDVMYGMDAGWAMEGAVGSNYKIDATYLSPHVNMASRMMSASKQYGVTILLSHAVHELLSSPCKKKLRHLDTVYVKGSNVAQKIYTYDARHKGVPFYLHEHSPEQADAEAEAYTDNVWERDQDLQAMRYHVSDAFMEVYKNGVEEYTHPHGDWNKAVSLLKEADDLMFQQVIDQGYLDYFLIECGIDEDDPELYDRNSTNEEIIRVRNEFGDGACKTLIQYMERRGKKRPDNWKGVRKLMSK